MTEEDAFLLAVLADPEDAAARLVYADWLLDRGDQRSELIRQAFLLRSTSASDPRRKAFASRWALARGVHDFQEYDGVLLNWEQLVTVFRFRLAEAIAFCASNQPEDAKSSGSVAMTGVGINWAFDDEQAWAAATHKVAIARRRLLAAQGRTPSNLATDLCGGRLLLYDPS